MSTKSVRRRPTVSGVREDNDVTLEKEAVVVVAEGSSGRGCESGVCTMPRYIYLGPDRGVGFLEKVRGPGSLSRRPEIPMSHGSSLKSVRNQSQQAGAKE